MAEEPWKQDPDEEEEDFEIEDIVSEQRISSLFHDNADPI